MRITRRANAPGLSSVEDPGTLAPLPRPANDATARDADPTDRVEVSADARLRQRLRADVDAVDDSDSTRVATLRARVVANAYQPDPAAVAHSLVSELAADLVV